MSDILAHLFKFRLDDRSVLESATLAKAVEQMQASRVHCLLVRDMDGRGVGVISEHDIVTAFARIGDDARNALVSDYMTYDLIVVKDTQELDEAITLMARHEVRHLPVVSEKGLVRGFLSVMDLITKKMGVEVKEADKNSEKV